MAFPLNFTTNSERAIKPVRANENGIAHILSSPDRIVVEPFKVMKINTELSFEMVGMYYGQLLTIADQKTFLVLGGVIDPGYRGDIFVPLMNYTEKKQLVERGDKIAYIIFIPVVLPILVNKEEEDNVDYEKLQMYVKYIKTDPSAYIPKRFDACSVGYDLRALKDTCIPPLGFGEVEIGIQFLIEGGPFYGQTCNKSGFSTERKLHVVDGIIDATYKSSVKVQFKNLSKEERYIYAGEEIAQIIFIPVTLPTLVHKKSINRNTIRGDRGFQSGKTKDICDHSYS